MRFVSTKNTKAGPRFYWSPPSRYYAQGLMVPREALGGDETAARARSEILNARFDSWMAGEGQSIRHGTLEWMLTQYQSHRSFLQCSPRTQTEYRRRIKRITALKLRKPPPGMVTVGDVPVGQVDERFADALYDRIREGRETSARQEITLLKQAWKVVSRAHPSTMAGNPFHGVTFVRRRTGVKPAATRAEAEALARGLESMGYPELAVAAMAAFDLHMRPENFLAGGLPWSGYRPGVSIEVHHLKTGEVVVMPLASKTALYAPFLESLLSRLPKVGEHPGLRSQGVIKPISRRRAADVVARCRERFNLPDHVTLDACRHGGITELSEAGLTEIESMALTGHRSPEAHRRYQKRTEIIRQNALTKAKSHPTG